MSRMRLKFQAADLLFPPRCLFCGEVKPFGEECPDCAALERTLRLTGNWRLDYGKSARALAEVTASVSSYLYTGAAAELVARYKFARRYGMAREMAKIMAGDVLETLGKTCCDIVIPVPASGRGRRHAALLAKNIAKMLSVGFSEGALQKTRETKAQHELSQDARGENLRGAFAVMHPEWVEGARVLLCDDVMTSGNTLNECAGILRRAGVKQVFAAAFSATPAAESGAGLTENCGSFTHCGNIVV